jgi:hypothetical protein
MAKRRSKEVGGFEEALQRAKQQAVEAELEKKKKKRREQQATVDVEEAERQRVAEVRRSPEWRQMLELSKDPAFLQALEAYWEKFSTKRRKEVSRKLKRSPLFSRNWGSSEEHYDIQFAKQTFKDVLIADLHPEYKYGFDSRKLKEGGKLADILSSGSITYHFYHGLTESWESADHSSDRPVYKAVSILYSPSEVEVLPTSTGGQLGGMMGGSGSRTIPGFTIPEGPFVVFQNSYPKSSNTNSFGPIRNIPEGGSNLIGSPEQFYDYIAGLIVGAK